MAKLPTYTLAWSSATQVYELSQTPERGTRPLVPESPEWFAWLNQISCFTFSGQSGHYTARKEANQPGECSWYACLASGEHRTTKYLGKTSDLTVARLEDLARLLHATPAGSGPPSPARPSLPGPAGRPAQGEAQAVPSPLSAGPGVGGEGEAARQALFPQEPDPLSSLLATKLHIPRPRPHLVVRSHLLAQLQQGMEQALTLISAPAGFGKTTLLAQWLAHSGMPVAWLSLEAEDNDPTRFLSYVIAALQTLDAQVGTTALEMLRTPQPPSPETVLAVLANDLVSHEGGDFVLVLDDYHVITADPIQRGMAFLLEHLPPQLHLILATRADPPLPLAWLRAQGQLCEVRAAHLRFGPAEASAFLQTVMGLDLEAKAIATLQQRTEGWVVGLQLAALSLQGKADVSAFLAAFTGTHRFVLDYLSEEVLARQPASVQQFLLHTSILERLSGPLCDAVTGQEGSQAMLEALERANLFVVPLDDERGWYRYHHLFAQVLRRHLQQAEPTLPPVLHRRASAWYEQHALPAEAVRHALAVPDAELAARLIEPLALPLAYQGQLSTVLGWMNALPEALVRTRPFLCVYHARLLLYSNQFEAAKVRLQEAEERFREEMPAEQTRTFHGRLLSIRAGIAGLSGNITHAVSLAREALELLPETEVIPRAGALVITAHVHMASGDVTSDSEHAVTAAVPLIRASGSPFAIVAILACLAHLHVLQGRLRQAAATYEQVMQAVPQPEILQTSFTSLCYYFGLGDLLREWNELDVAEQHLAQGMALVNETQTVDPFWAVLGYTALARLEQARGNTHAALATLDALERLAERRHFPPHLMTQGAAGRAQLELAQGNVAAAIRWADSSGLSAEDEDLSYLREGEYLALGRVRMAQGRDDPATPLLQDVLCLLDRLLQNAEAKARLNSVLHILVLRALALEVQGDQTSALSTLEHALVLAEPEGYIRLFVDEGAPMRALLRQTHARSRVPGYVATLLAAFGEQHASDLPLASARPGPLAEPLTKREREVLRLLLEGASNREIARRLVLSVNTVKRHVYNLCGKLGVQSRTQAIARARSLHLV